MLDRKSTRRSDQVRAQNRRILLWSLAIAALLHAAFFVFSPTFDANPDAFRSTPSMEDTLPGNVLVPLYVRVTFGPPEILGEDGAVHREPADRFLQAERLIKVPDECRTLFPTVQSPQSARVRLRLDWKGRVIRARVDRSTGRRCEDEIVLKLARLLWYQWLPSDRYPSPVNLVQPVRLAAAESSAP